MTTSPIFDGPRRIRRDELHAAKQLSNLCFNLGILPDDVGPNVDVDSAPSGEAGETYIIAADGRPVSQIRAFQERIHVYDGLIRAGSIGAVCTHPDYRGHGLATKLMELCTRKLAEGGARLMLISGGRGLYTRLGFIRAGRCANLSLRPGQVTPLSRHVTLRPIARGNAAADAMVCSRLYACEPVRFRRSLEHMRNHLCYDPQGHHLERWIVEMDGRPEAYVLLTTDWQNIRHPEVGQRRVNEYAGSRVALAAALAVAAQQGGIQVLDVGIPWQDVDLIRLLSEMAGPPQWTPLSGHTLRIINFPGMLADLRGYVRSRLTQALRRGLRFEQSGPLLGAEGGDRCAIVRGVDRLELSVAQMTALVMGTPATGVSAAEDEEEEPAAAEPAALPPFPGALAEIIPALFPLPSFLPGLNYH
jgi:GNAT superfamily N-acetyltransferase